MRIQWPIGLTVVILVSGLAGSAHAQVRREGLATDDRVSLSALLGYGLRISNDGDLDDNANPYGVAIGLRGGYTISRVYLGGLFDYFVGEGVSGGPVSGHLNQINLAADVGYDIAASFQTVIRPSIAIGTTVVTGDICVLNRCDQDQTDALFLVAPSVAVLVAFDRIYVGGEIRYFYLPDDGVPDGLLFGIDVGALL